MPKENKIVRIHPLKVFGWYSVSFGKHQPLAKYVDSLPGTTYARDLKAWVVPIDCIQLIEAAAQVEGFSSKRQGFFPCFPKSSVELNPSPREINANLHDYQMEAVERALILKRLFIHFDMGLGKTPTAIEIHKHAGQFPWLIVCPAIARRVWTHELQKWWSEHPEVELIESGEQAKVSGADIVIVSFNLLKTLGRKDFRSVTVDEMHTVKTAGKTWNKELKQVIGKAEPKQITFLTGTPIDNEPRDLYGQGDLLIPGMFGTEFDFKRRYCNEMPNEFAMSGKAWEGLNPQHAEELRQRIQAISVRVTKEEVKHLLPPLQMSTIRVRPERLSLRELTEKLRRADLHNSNIRATLLKTMFDQKIKAAKELIQKTQKTAPKVVVLCHLRKTAEKLGKLLGGTVITGNTTTAKRHKILAEEQEKDTSLLIATMHSLSTGLSLSHYTEVVYIELDWRIGEVSQSMARYHRVNGTEPVRIQILILEGTYEEMVADTLARRLEDAAKVIAPGKLEASLSETLEGEEDDMLSIWRSMAESTIEEEAYL